jgi:outer membrane protein OmpA-like peptidoglycan-associated protein
VERDGKALGAALKMMPGCARRLAAIALVFGSCAICSAQSHDPKKPTPLGPGINKGNIDNVGNGPNYYYFYAGPGHVEMNYAFKEMGVFGNPLRQSLNFDLFNPGDKLISHNAVVSLDKLEHLLQPGDLDARIRLVLRITSPDAAIRMGGYYEVEVKGAATFEGNTTGANVKAEDTSLTKGPVTLTQGPVTLTQGPAGITKGPPALTGSQVSLYQPVGALTAVHEGKNELRLTLSADILFDFDKSTIRPDSKAALDRVAEIIRSKSRGEVKIEGFTDSKGAADYNLRLSMARAQSVMNWLIEREGLRSVRFATEGAGSTRFTAPNTKPDGSDDPAGRQKNRRVEVIIRKGD